MEYRFGQLPTIVEGSSDQSDTEELPVSYGCVAEPVPKVLGGHAVRVRDDADESPTRFKFLDNSLNAFFKELWAGRNVVKREVVADDVKRPALHSAYVTNLKGRGQAQTLGAFPRFRKSRDIWVDTDKPAPGPLPEVAATAAPTVQDELARLDALLNKLPLE